MGGTRPADRPASAGRWGRQALTDHSHEDGEGAVDAVLFTVQDPRTARHRRVPTAHDQRQRQKTAKHEGTGTPRVSQFLLIMFRLPPRLRERLGFLAGWPAQGMGREIWRR